MGLLTTNLTPLLMKRRQGLITTNELDDENKRTQPNEIAGAKQSPVVEKVAEEKNSEPKKGKAKKGKAKKKGVSVDELEDKAGEGR